jgi:methionyl-tRNA formyltransferase
MSSSNSNIKYVFFGSSQFSVYVLDELRSAGFVPVLTITSAREPLPTDKLREIGADVFIVASFGKILPLEVINMPKYGSLNVHPSLLPKLRGPSPIQNLILQDEKTGVTIIKMDEEMDHGPIIAQEEVAIHPWPDKYEVVEEKLARAGGKLLVEILSKTYSDSALSEGKEQEHDKATYTKLIKKEYGLLDLSRPAEENLRKVLAYSVWPSAYMMFKRRTGQEIRVVVKDAEIKDGAFLPTHVIPAGKKEMSWQDFLRGNI